jgi:hypothetical protein
MERFNSQLPAELLHKAKLEALNRKVPLHVILTEAVAAYLKAPAGGASPAKKRGGDK